MFVYQLTFPNNKKYIGITKNFNHRMSNHIYSAKIGKNSKLYKAIRKYTWTAVKKEILFFDLTLEEANKKEIELIAQYNLCEKGYNISAGGYIPSANLAQLTKDRMKNPMTRAIALAGLHSEESKNKVRAWIRSAEFRKQSSLRMKERIKNNDCPLPRLNKIVKCEETGEIFNSITEAALHFKGRREHLRDHLKGVKYRKKFKGLHFTRVGN